MFESISGLSVTFNRLNSIQKRNFYDLQVFSSLLKLVFNQIICHSACRNYSAITLSILGTYG